MLNNIGSKNLVPGFSEISDQLRTDVSFTAKDNYFHGFPSLFLSGSQGLD
jgi:hypothetical protein